MSDAQWSDDRVTTLKSLWLDGFSASKIAKQLGGVTRNAVIGKVHRLGLSGRITPTSLKGPARIRPESRPAALPEQIRATPEGPGLVTCMAALGAHVCKWPIGDPKAAGFSFCGLPADGSYCEGHAAFAYRPGKAIRLYRDPVVRRVLAGLAA